MRTPNLTESLQTVLPILQSFEDHPTVQIKTYTVYDFGIRICGHVEFGDRMCLFTVSYTMPTHKSESESIKYPEKCFILMWRWRFTFHEGMEEDLTLNKVFELLTREVELDARSYEDID